MTARECHGIEPFTRTTEDATPAGGSQVRYRCRRCMYSVAFRARGRTPTEIDGYGRAAILAHMRRHHAKAVAL